MQPAQPADACQIFGGDITGGQRRQRRIAQGGVREMRQMHIPDAPDGLSPSLPAAEFGRIAGVTGNGYEILQPVGWMGNGHSRAIHDQIR